MIRLLKMMMENAHKNGVWVGICGELSVRPPRTVLPLRNAIRSIDIRETSPAILTAIKSDETPKH